MRGQDSRSGSLFSYVDLEQRVRSDHPLRTIHTLVIEALASLDGRFGEIYSEIGRPSIPPEQLLRAMLLQAFYSVRSERQLMEQLGSNLLFCWFVGLGIDDPVWDASTFSKSRDRLLDGSVAAAFPSAVLAIPRVKRLLSQDRFSVDGTLIQAWASMKSFKPKDDGMPSAPPDAPAPPRAGVPDAMPRCLPRPALEQRHAPEHHGPRGPAPSQGTGAGSQAVLHGTRPDEKPQRFARGRLRH